MCLRWDGRERAGCQPLSNGREVNGQRERDRENRDRKGWSEGVGVEVTSYTERIERQREKQ